MLFLMVQQGLKMELKPQNCNKYTLPLNTLKLKSAKISLKFVVYAPPLDFVIPEEKLVLLISHIMMPIGTLLHT